MNKNKFRGLNKENQWVYGNLIETNRFVKHKPKQHTKTWIVTSSFGNGGWFNILGRQYVKPETVCRGTGIIDTNSKELYENDIVEYSEYFSPIYFNKIYTIKWRKAGFWFWDGENEEWADMFCTEWRQLRKVGNIFHIKEDDE